MMRVEAATVIRAPQQTVSDLYAGYNGWPCLFPAINGVRLIGTDGQKLILEIDHAEGKVRDELVIRSPGEIDLWEARRRYTAWFVNRFETTPGGTRYSVRGEFALKGVARLFQPFLRGYMRRQIRRRVLEPVKTSAERRAGAPAAAPAGPREPADRWASTATVAAYAAAALAFAYAAVSLYWTAGGTLLLGTLGGTMRDIASGGGLLPVALGLAAAVLKAAGGVLALSLARRWGRAAARRRLRTVAGLASAVLTCYGAVQVAAGALVLSGAIHPPGTADRGALLWHAAVWDMWFLVWGLLLAVAVMTGVTHDHYRHRLAAPR